MPAERVYTASELHDLISRNLHSRWGGAGFRMLHSRWGAYKGLSRDTMSLIFGHHDEGEWFHLKETNPEYSVRGADGKILRQGWRPLLTRLVEGSYIYPHEEVQQALGYDECRKAAWRSRANKAT